MSTWLAVRILPTWLLQRCFCHGHDADATAAILFSSGSEGEPKGVMLSHRNLMANIKQTSDVLNTQSNDVVMGSLPLFHAFGLTVTQLLPLIEGLPLVCHPTPPMPLALRVLLPRTKPRLCSAPPAFKAVCTQHKGASADAGELENRSRRGREARRQRA
ncbi:hypothetical protein HORIV_13590 [Vreelandella olivaria]|uniref:AMP-dependent synthetase/ligase domain-containing protein n=1 Tax=Vreelandella olivaria TaxID=390919 RepID=A0ABM7GEL0_9GAMM|nr:hypothetical protein HORIV_13590 [Halomonas olivaria]